MRPSLLVRATFLVALSTVFVTSMADAQLVDRTNAPHTENNAAVQKSLTQQIGAGRGNATTPNSSIYLITRDPFRSIRRGRQIFQRKFALHQGLGPITGDGTGDIELDDTIGAGLSDSCAGCHGRPRGSAGHGGDVATRPDSRDAPHLFGLGLVEMLADEMTFELRKIRDDAVQTAINTNTPTIALLITNGVDFGSVTGFPNGTVDYSMVEGVDQDLRVKPFFHDGRSFSIREFAVGAFNAEMGLEAADPDLIAASTGGFALTPSGMALDGSLDTIPAPPSPNPASDPDGDGVTNEVDTALVDHMEFYLLNYFRPANYAQTGDIARGRAVFDNIGCAKCHMPDLQIDKDRRVADVDTAFDPVQGIFNQLFSTATPLVNVIPDPPHPPRQVPLLNPFLVTGIYSDLKRHDLGPKFHERQYDGTIKTHFVTEPLWGVGTTAPYGHDGRSINLNEVILRHGGEAQVQRDLYAELNTVPRNQLLAFLQSLVLFPPDDTASNLDPGNPLDPDFPQRGHGAIDLSVLFLIPADKE
ncbi:MAG TPA: di-heme oxidoredictase family protein [Thermoanaerobaculia bacterium]|nr:di-heme oxidoredictase family protein [Thermoanaerobaculia bacterium]